jgi:hypothetical protein
MVRIATPSTRLWHAADGRTRRSAPAVSVTRITLDVLLFASIYIGWVYSVQNFPIRRDKLTGEEVSLGRMKLIKNAGEKKYTLQKYMEILQCSQAEPEISNG